MSELEQLEKKVAGLPPEELAQFREWFTEFDWQKWDEKIEVDLNSGKLDQFISDAMADYDAGKAREL